MKYYLHKGCLIAVLLLSTLFYPSANADSFRVGFGEVNGHGVYPDIMQINNIRVELLDRLDNTRVADVIYYNLYFKVCDTVGDSTKVTLRPSLTGEEIICSLTNGFDFRDSFITEKTGNSVTITNVHTPEAIYASINLSFDENTLFLNQNILYEMSTEKDADMPNYPNHISISLKWQDPPRDLDAHLTGPNCDIRTDNYCNENNRFHIYFANRSNEVAKLNAAEFSDSRPESIEIYPNVNNDIIRPGLYRFTTHHFVGRDGKISDSNAEVVMSVCMRGGSCETKGFFALRHDDANVLQGESDSWVTFEFRIGNDGALEGVWSPTTPYYANVHPDDVW